MTRRVVALAVSTSITGCGVGNPTRRSRAFLYQSSTAVRQGRENIPLTSEAVVVDRRAAELIDVVRAEPYEDLTALARRTLPYLVAALGLRAHGAVLHWVHPATLQ